MSFAPKVGRYFTPFLGLPLDDWITIVVCLQPLLCTGNHLKEGLRRRGMLELGLTLPLRHPEDGIIAVGVDGLVVKSLLPSQCQCVDNSKEFTYIIGAVDRSEVKHPRTRLQVDGLIFHRARIARAGSIHSPRVCPYLWRQGQNRVVAV